MLQVRHMGRIGNPLPRLPQPQGAPVGPHHHLLPPTVFP